MQAQPSARPAGPEIRQGVIVSYFSRWVLPHENASQKKNHQEENPAMITVRKAAERGVSNFGWLDSRHTFSFGEYHDPRQMGFRVLRVINDDRIAGGQGFGTHPHRDMEIITYVVEGAVEHRDSMGNGSVIRAGDVQVMSAGTGITHSEFNPDPKLELRLLQIWILPKRQGLTPSYDQKNFSADQKKNRLCPLVSRDGRDGSLGIHQDVALYGCVLDAGTEAQHAPVTGRHAWIQIVTGEIEVNGIRLGPGDGASVSDEKFLKMSGISASEFLLFDLA